MERRSFPASRQAPPRRLDALEAVIVTRNSMDAQLSAGFLRDEGLRARPVATVEDLLELPMDQVGCVVLPEESLAGADGAALEGALQAQPPWSDLPLVILVREGSSMRGVLDAAYPQSGNVSLLQRPLHPVALATAVAMAMRARSRQIQVRDLLQERTDALRWRDEFLAMLAHELRNPLTPIRNAVHLLAGLPRPEPLFSKCRGMIEKQVRHITRLVDDLLDVSRLELGKVTLQPQRLLLDEVIAAAVEAAFPDKAAPRHVVRVQTCDEPLAVMADPVRLEQVVCNLLLNAAKFTPPGGTITVSTARESGQGRITVTDTGIGIPVDRLEGIFELFRQEPVSLARSNGGLGIGLTLVRRLVELHGGRVRARSGGPGEGATFDVRLPLVAPSVVTPPAQAAGSARGPSRRILIVEDGKDTRESLGMLIEAWGHHVAYAADGPEGVDRARAERPDVILVDIGLPGFDGYMVARSIRAESASWGAGVRLIALTGYGQAADKARAMASGFDAHVVKPVEPHVLRDMLVAPL